MPSDWHQVMRNRKNNDFMKLSSVPAPQVPNLPTSTVRSRVLVLEDDPDVRSLYALALARAGYTVDTAADGEEGWEALCANAYDLLLTDNDMPRLTGVELVRRLRRAGQTLPVIIASGSIALPEGGDGRRLGSTMALHKPLTPDELVDAVQHAVPIQPGALGLIRHREAPVADLISATERRFAALNE